jgi:hypothetical protein
MKLNRLLTAGLILAGITVYVACRKVDRPMDRPAAFTENGKFFSNHRTADPTEAAIVDFIKRKNAKSPFIDKVISQIGYPYWDKIMSFKKPLNTSNGRGNTGDSASIYYIPFVRDSQNYVNASLMIKAQQGDTTMQYACDWQYQSRVHGSPNVDTTAEKLALFFMLLDNRTFGYTEFDITDNNLFQEAVAGPNGKRKLGFINISSPNAGRNNLMVYNEVCMDFYICGDPNGEYTCYNGCDYLNCAAAVGQPYHCYSYSFCEGWWEETGGGGTGTGTGGTGGTSGGSGGTGGTTPPECPGTVTPDNVTNPCGPGWNPMPPEGPTTNDPCIVANNLAKLMDTLYMLSKADSVTNTIPNLFTEPNERGFPIFRRFALSPQNVLDTTFTYYHSGAISYGNDSSVTIASTPPYLSVLAASLHTHPPSGFNAHSAIDVYKFIAERLVNGYYMGSFAYAYNGEKYVLTVTNLAQAAAFYGTMSQNLNDEDWNPTSQIGEEFKSAEKYFLALYKNETNKANLAYEMAMAAVLTKFNTGVTLNKMDANGKFKPLIVSITTDPHKPKRKIYTQLCP